MAVEKLFWQYHWKVAVTRNTAYFGRYGIVETVAASDSNE